MRTMNEHILEECNARGIDIVCTCFDGQWIKLATRDVDERPLTLLQLQRDVYETASKEKRNTILKHLSEKPIADDLENDVCAIRNEKGSECHIRTITETLEVLIESENLISCEDDVAPLDDNETTDTNEPDTTQNASANVLKIQLFEQAFCRMILDSYRSWISKSPFNETTEVEGVGHVKWFSYPEVSEKRNKMEPKCLDAHHLLVNLRVKVCKDGLQGIQKRAWHAVAEKNRDIISKSLVVDLIDKQNNAFALRTFSTDVESEMRILGFIREADFCKLIREWYEAEDESGISAVDRMKRRINLKSFLLEGVDFGRYLMYRMYVKGFPKVQFEGFLQRIDTSLQLYSVVKNGSFNQRAISSLANETFFSELSEMEPTKLGCPKAVNIPRLMSTVTELHHFRSNPNDRSFKIVTTRKSVYPSPDLVEHVEDDAVSHQCDQIEEMDTSPIKISSINLREHAFDRAKRKRKKRVTKRSDVSMPNQVARGCMPIRFHHRCDESKVLPTTRLGIDMKDPSAV
ncbi:unnamed protein product [Mytilus coruscus]|uniref:Uncharacterized protein n=1 Tax=Mytilus coruscus TaxID=42192 RepID=A0A6J8CZ43_MYTCO|nr:unnamed protein product [Mytilus coruscus]